MRLDLFQELSGISFTVQFKTGHTHPERDCPPKCTIGIPVEKSEYTAEIFTERKSIC